MDFQNRAGSKTGSGGLASSSESNYDRKERLRKLALESIDLSKDPYCMKNHLGSYECRLCLTLHLNEGSYLSHTQGKKHTTNLARRVAREQVDGSRLSTTAAAPGAARPSVLPVRRSIKIGRPGYQVTKIRNPANEQLGLLFKLQYPKTSQAIKPRYRFMSAFEQKVEQPDKDYQYVLFAAEPFETIAFKLQAREIERIPEKFWTNWDQDSGQFHMQIFFKSDPPTGPRFGSRG